MSNLLATWTTKRTPTRSASTLSFSDYLQLFSFNGIPYSLQQTLGGNREEIGAGFDGVVAGAYKSNGVVFACMLARMLLFSEARLQFRARNNGRPGDLFGTPDLKVLETPWLGGTTGDLLTRLIVDADLAGNAFVARRRDQNGQPMQPDRLMRLRPDWVRIILGSNLDAEDPAAMADAEPVGYVYMPGGKLSRHTPQIFTREEVAHFAPLPDPVSPYRGMSWLTPVIREITADAAATVHKQKFFENGATPNMVVSLDPQISPEDYKLWKAEFDSEQTGFLNAYKTLFVGGGADVQVVGKDFQQVDFKATQGAGETRIAAAAGVPPVIVGLSEGLQAATYSNYAQARRRFADGTMRPLWRNLAGSLQVIVPPPPGSELWYDDRDIPFLFEDAKDKAEMQGNEARTIRQLVDAGFTPDSVVAAVMSQDWSQLTHTGLYSVQLQPPNSTPPASDGNAGRALASLIGPYLALPGPTE